MKSKRIAKLVMTLVLLGAAFSAIALIVPDHTHEEENEHAAATDSNGCHDSKWGWHCHR